jgi:hypothetical protein
MKNLIMSLALAATCSMGFAGQALSGTAGQGTIVDMTGLDGCTFLIRLDDGRLLEADVPTELQVDGLRVSIDYTEEARVSICMAGETVILNSIAPLN